MDTNLSDDMVKLVRYSIVSIQRDHEALLERGEEIFDDNMTDDAFATWVIAKYGDDRGLTSEERKYLRVSHEVLRRWPRQEGEYDRRKIRVLQEIRDRLPRRSGTGATGATGATGPTGGTGSTGATGPGGTSAHSVQPGQTEELQELQERFGTKDIVIPGQEDPYQEFFYRLELSRDTISEWRRLLRRANRKYADQIAEHFNRFRDIGSLQAPEIDAEALGDALGEDEPSFHRESFDRFTGPALGVLRVYTFERPDAEPAENPAPDVHSIWGEVREPQPGEFVQRITGSGVDYVDPDDDQELRRYLSKLQVDLTLNVYTEDWGMVSWSAFYQNHANQMRSFGYEVGDAIVWFNQFMLQDMRPTVEDQLVLSYDWARKVGDEQHFGVYAMHLDFDFKANEVKFAGPVLKLDNTVIER